MNHENFYTQPPNILLSSPKKDSQKLEDFSATSTTSTWEAILEKAKTSPNRTGWQITMFLGLVNANFKTKHAVAFYASELHICPDYLRQVSRKILTMTPSECIRTRIIVEAISMLAEKQGLSIGEIAHLLGFYDSSHFDKLFSKYLGVSPSEYRSLRLAHEKNSVLS